MAAQLDDLGAGLLKRALRELGIEVLVGRRIEAVTGEGRPETVVLDDGERLPADLVIVAAGIQPDVQLANAAGLEVGRGVIVDDELRASTPGVWAVGECAEHRGTVYGLWAPVLAQAKTAGASLGGRPAAFHGTAPATTLKVSGVDLFCGGTPESEEGDEVVLSLDSRRGVYRRLILREGRLRGALLIGDLSDAPSLSNTLATGAPVPDGLLAGGDARREEGEASGLVCSCHRVSAEEIHRACAGGADTAEAVGRATGATTGCGGCRGEVERLLGDLEQERRRELARVSGAAAG
jgi:ferredoxin-nitrate reductase